MQRSGAGAKPEQRPFFRLDERRFLTTYFPCIGSVVGSVVVVCTSTLSTSIGLLPLPLSWLLSCVVVVCCRCCWRTTCDLPFVIVALFALNGPILVDNSLCNFDGNNVFGSYCLASLVLTDSGSFSLDHHEPLQSYPIFCLGDCCCANISSLIHCPDVSGYDLRMPKGVV